MTCFDDGDLAGLAEALAIAISINLDGGVPAAHLVEKLLHTRFVPAGPTGDPAVPHATSLADYLARQLARTHLTPAERRSLGLPETGAETPVAVPAARAGLPGAADRSLQPA
ncbi:hypothetical protein [Actinocorallia longicatena]|uniref:ribonucleoside-diphosphate reductase n=1 Tax=Actinocorallia longicatena TaxID=111803 RepID=A0ABP6QKM4_9ACTN